MGLTREPLTEAERDEFRAVIRAHMVRNPTGDHDIGSTSITSSLPARWAHTHVDDLAAVEVIANTGRHRAGAGDVDRAGR